MPRMRSIFDSDDSPSSPSLEKLILAELREFEESSASSSSSSSSSSSGRGWIGNRSPTSTLDFGSEMRFRSWSIPGRRKQKSSESDASSPPQPPLPASKQVSGCVAGCAGDCTAVCCCPLTVIHILFLKIPALIVSKLSEVCRKTKMRLSQATYSTATESRAGSPALSPSASIRPPQDQASSPEPSASVVTPGIKPQVPESTFAAIETAPEPERPPPPLKIPAWIQKQMGFASDHWREFDSPHSSVSGS